jgi:hypothetical protein
MIKNLWNSLEELNLNNVQSVSFGFKELQDVRLWHVVVEYNFATIVEVQGVLMVAAQVLEG